MRWMILPFKRYAQFSGRSRRMEFWMFGLLNFLVAVVLAGPIYRIFFSQMMSDSMANRADMNMQGMAPGAIEADALGSFSLAAHPIATVLALVYLVYALAVLIPSIAVTVRRLHDRNMSGWWYLGFMVLAFIPLLGLLASLAFLIVMFLPGTAGPNRFGEDPKDPLNAQVFE